MSDARDHVLSTIRTALGRGELDASARARLDERLKNPAPNVIPARARGTPEELSERFIVEAQRADAGVERLASLNEVPMALARFLATTQSATHVKAAPHPVLQNLNWRAAPTLEITFGAATPEDATGLALAYAGIAETGTLAMRSGPESPTELNFLPETEIVVLPAARIVGAYEDVWRRLRADGGADFMPRAVNFITGPSRTADIEQTLLLGAHGPGRLLILVIDDDVPI